MDGEVTIAATERTPGLFAEISVVPEGLARFRCLVLLCPCLFFVLLSKEAFRHLRASLFVRSRLMASNFADLCVPIDENNVPLFEKTLANLKEFGFHAAAVTHRLELLQTKQTPIPPCPDKSTVAKWAKQSGLTLYTRLTVSLTENSQLHALAQEAVRAYDILAVEPTTEKLFYRTCASLEADIISFDFTQRLLFFLKTPQVRQAIRRGMSFEILYSPMILDAAARRNTLTAAMELIEASKGKNVVLSSGSRGPMDVRGPYDVMNLGLLFGLKEAMAKETVSVNCRAVIRRAVARRETSKGVTSMRRVDELAAGEEWVMKKLKDDDEDSDIGTLEKGDCGQDKGIDEKKNDSDSENSGDESIAKKPRVS